MADARICRRRGIAGNIRFNRAAAKMYVAYERHLLRGDNRNISIPGALVLYTMYRPF